MPAGGERVDDGADIGGG
uniref:Uncharacterized protein n=1 Tax=Arundo donax TaxID=35708 RepID=A0A0A8Y276_ARUDO